MENSCQKRKIIYSQANISLENDFDDGAAFGDGADREGDVFYR